MGAAEGLAALGLPDDVRGDLKSGHVLHAGLMDLATGWAMALVPGYAAAHLWVPVSYGLIRVHGSLPADVQSHVRLAAGKASGGFARFDVTLTDETGTVLVEVRDFAMKRSTGRSWHHAADSIRSASSKRRQKTPRQLSAAEERLAYLVSQGIRAAEGPEALRRALALGRPQVMVSSLPLDALMAQADAARRGAGHKRAELSNAPIWTAPLWPPATGSRNVWPRCGRKPAGR